MIMVLGSVAMSLQNLQENMGSSILLHCPGTLRVMAFIAERAVQTAKNLMKKAKVERRDLQFGLLDYRNNPIEEIGLLLAQMLMGRRTRTKLPTTPALLKLQHPTENIKEGLSRRSEIQQQYYNRNAKVLKPLNTGDTVRVRKPGQKTWTSAVVTRVTEAPRSYVDDAEGTSYRRNRRDLIKTTEATNQQPDLEDSKTNTTNPVHDSVRSESQFQGSSHPTTCLA